MENNNIINYENNNIIKSENIKSENANLTETSPLIKNNSQNGQNQQLFAKNIIYGYESFEMCFICGTYTKNLPCACKKYACSKCIVDAIKNKQLSKKCEKCNLYYDDLNSNTPIIVIVIVSLLYICGIIAGIISALV